MYADTNSIDNVMCKRNFRAKELSYAKGLNGAKDNNVFVKQKYSRKRMCDRGKSNKYNR